MARGYGVGEAVAAIVFGKNLKPDLWGLEGDQRFPGTNGWDQTCYALLDGSLLCVAHNGVAGGERVVPHRPP